VTRRTASRVLFALAVASAALTVLLALGGGFSARIAGVRVSAHAAIRPLLFALLSGAIALKILAPDEQTRVTERLTKVGTRLAPWTAAAAAATMLAVCLAYGTRTAGGADSYGYLSQARLWLRGELHVRQDSAAAAAPWPDAEWTFTPLGYRPAANHTLVPAYAPGLPLLMATFAKLAGRCGPYLVTPLCAAFVVALAYLLGVRLSGPATGLAAALVVATSPSVVFMSLSSMSDVPAAAFWTAALLLTCTRSTIAATGLAGIASGTAIAIRPNLVPLAAFPALLVVLGAGQCRLRRAAVFAAGCLPFVLLVAAVNQDLYGSPLRSGYGDLSSLFSISNAPANIPRFVRWLAQTQGPLAFLCLLAPVAAWRQRPSTDDSTRGPARTRFVLLAFIAGVFACYLLYTPFEAWWFLRFVLPAFPTMFVLAADAVWIGASRFGRTARAVAMLVFTLVCVDWGVRLCREENVLDLGEAEQKYGDVGRFVARELPPNAAVITLLHSGSVRYYSGRITLRYEWLDPQGLDRAVEYLKRSGLEPFVLLEASELAEFREKFRSQTTLAALDRPPIATHPRGVNLYAIDPTPVAETPRVIPRTSGCE
jgi:hypothetical protein